MGSIKWNLLTLSITATCSIIAFGVFLASYQYIGMLLSVLVLIAVMGTGFKIKKRLRENSEL